MHTQYLTSIQLYSYSVSGQDSNKSCFIFISQSYDAHAILYHNLKPNVYIFYILTTASRSMNGSSPSRLKIVFTVLGVSINSIFNCILFNNMTLSFKSSSSPKFYNIHYLYCYTQIHFHLYRPTQITH